MPARHPREQFYELGYLSPEPVLTAGECARLLHHLADGRRPPPEWSKGEAASSRTVFEVATHERIIEKVRLLLGDDVMVWGARLIAKAPQRTHPWHSDIETWTDRPGKFVTVWLGLENASRDSSLQTISCSHLFGVTVQQLRHEVGRGRNELTDDEIVAWATQREGRSEIVAFDIGDGEALFIDGRIWHTSRNLTQRTRKALLLQYATPDTVIRIPDLSSLEWPFRYLDQRPPCVLVHGADTFRVNRMVGTPPAPAPSPQAPTRVESRTHALHLPLSPDGEDGWKAYACFKGGTENLDVLSAHASALVSGRCPHPPHRHLEEELLLVLDGEVEVDLPDVGQRPRLKPGDIVYYPATFAHTITTVGPAPANYFMVKWSDRSAKSQTDVTLPFGRFNYRDPVDSAKHRARKNGFSFDVLFQGATLYLHTLHCHYSSLAPGGGYEPHADPYDVVLLVLEGEVETAGQRLAPHSVILHPARAPHGIHNPGSVTARYLVFEFHTRRGPAPRQQAAAQSLASKLVDFAAWKRWLATLRRRVPM